jgi:Carboxypeptidase regulatory-like domain
MRVFTRTVVLSGALALLGTSALLAAPDSALETLDLRTAGAVLGRVTSDKTPLETAWVYAYQIADFSLEKAATNGDGSFRFAGLPAGLYKFIAFKAGFVPAVVMLSRATAEATQTLDLDLLPALPDESVAETGFWSLRERIPPDVLRDIEALNRRAAAEPGFALTHVPDGEFRAEMQATAGFQEGLDFGSAQVSSGRVGIDGHYGDVRLGVTGRFSELQTEGDVGAQGANGSTQAISVRVDSSEDSHVNVSSLSNRMDTLHDGEASVDFESHSLRWSQKVGSGRSDFTAHYVSESNFHRQGGLVPAEVPVASRALRVEGSYTTPLSSRTTIQAGFRYREMQSEYAPSRRAFSLLPEETVELFGRGGLQVKPAVVIEYGLYSTLRDGTLSLVPQGGVVFRLGENWQASTLASHRIDDGEVLGLTDFSPLFYGEGEACQAGEMYCYQVLLTRSWGEDESLSFGAIDREYGETLRLYFNRDFFSRLESLFLVRGDRVPELQFGLTRRLRSDVLTRIESNLAVGGGGLLLANNRTYENQVQYLVTSIDTHFEHTATGLYVAFHHLQQEFETVNRRGVRSLSETELERLQFRVTQDLSFLRNLAADWAVHLNLELSRGSTPDLEPDDVTELRKRLTGGIVVSF